MPRIVKLYIRNVLIGYVVAAAFVAVLLLANVANLAHLIFSSPQWALALFMLWFFNGIVFAGVQFSRAVMSMAEKPEDDEPRGGVAMPILAEVRVPAQSPGRARKV